MPKIHMETERAISCAESLDQQAADLFSKVNHLKGASNRLSMGWVGSGTPESFKQDLESWIRQTNEKAQELQTLSLRLTHETNKWENADQTWQEYWKGITPIALGTIGLGTFDWVNWTSGAIDDVLKIAQDIPYDSINKLSYDDLGRFLNTLVGDSDAGWVGEMDSLGHILKNPIISNGVPIGLGIVGDILNGESIEKAVVSQGVKAGANALIGMIPVVGEIYVGYQIGLSIGNLVAGGLELMGDTTDAVILQNTMDELDFTDTLSNSLYDFLSNSFPDLFT